jgi:glutathione peroxidase
LLALGFASNDFDQGSKTDKEIADVCFINYGVTFDIFSLIHVTGKFAHLAFKELAMQTTAPA